MRITRAPRRNNFAIIPNAVIEDARLSYKARGILAYLLSRPDGWTTSADRLAHGSDGDGRAAVLAGMKELEAHGYLVRIRVQDAATGLWSTALYIYDAPGDNGAATGAQPGDNGGTTGAQRGDNPDPTESGKSTPGDALAQVAPSVDYPTSDKPTVGSPDVGSPDVGSSDVGKPVVINKTDHQDLEQEKALGGVTEVSYDPREGRTPPDAWTELGGGGELPRPDRCRAHQRDPGRGPDCWECRDARISHETRKARDAAEAAERARVEARVERDAGIRARREGVAACPHCDASGYRGAVVCDHSPPRSTSSDGYRQVREILAARRSHRVEAGV